MRPPLRLVLDTNVWLDWLVFRDPGITALQSAVGSGAAVIYIDEACSAELMRVLGYPMQKWTLDAARQADCMAQCLSVASMTVTSAGSALLTRNSWNWPPRPGPTACLPRTGPCWR